jgi:hypothetical protein
MRIFPRIAYTCVTRGMRVFRDGYIHQFIHILPYKHIGIQKNNPIESLEPIYCQFIPNSRISGENHRVIHRGNKLRKTDYRNASFDEGLNGSFPESLAVSSSQSRAYVCIHRVKGIFCPCLLETERQREDSAEIALVRQQRYPSFLGRFRHEGRPLSV